MLARYLDANPTLVQGKRVMEFGAAGALPFWWRWCMVVALL